MEKQSFKPYISAEKTHAEFTKTAVITGILLAVVFGAANAYLGLRVGLTVSASIPASVVAMGVVRMILRKNSILESNLVQTIGSAGESVAAGAVFTLPALFLWAAEGMMEKPSFLEMTVISLCGGLLGVFFMIPLRETLIVKEHGVLPYPEGTACSQVLLAGEQSGAGAKTVFSGMGIAAFFKFLTDGFRLVAGEVTLRIKTLALELGTQIYPAVFSVGYICGPKISAYMLSGGLISWAVLIPLMVLFGREAVISPETVSVGTLYETGGASALWSGYIRYIGAGALACGGLLSLIKSIPLIFTTFQKGIKGIGGKKQQTLRTEQDLSFSVVLSAVIVLTVAIAIFPEMNVSPLGATAVVVFSFFFATVSSRMVGLVGSSNNPISGMAIATLLLTSLLLRVLGGDAVAHMRSAITVGSIVCIVASVAGDTSQDLKTGFLLGATPKKQQLGEIIGVVAASVTIGGTLYLLDTAWGFGSEELAAPQATLMKLIVEGAMLSKLPWELVAAGAFLAVILALLRLPVLPVAIGIYLPVQLSVCVMAGGAVRLLIEYLSAKRKNDAAVNRGVLFCSGMIAGEGVVGVLLAVLAILGLERKIDFSHVGIPSVASVVVFGLIIVSLMYFSLRENTKRNRT